jgi:2-amino-4-hydroxy-6-hydroxymethyldihydropteridine diphosphokinase
VSRIADETVGTGHPRPAVAVVALGTNLGDRQATLEAALADLSRLPLTDRLLASHAIETVAVKTGGEDAAAPRYLNAVALLGTRLAPTVLLERLHAIEAAHGRERRERWGDRTLDLDLITYGEVESADARLTLPHPRAAERVFVLAPWLEVDPDAALPGFGPVAGLLARLQETR